jgi:hypothetical protein
MEQHPAGDPRCSSLRSRESSAVEAGDERRRQLAWPQTGKEIGNDRPGLRLAAARGLQLDIRTKTEFGKKRYRLLQGRDALPGKGRPEPPSGIMVSDRRERKLGQPAMPVCRAPEPIVVQQNRTAIGGETNVELDPTTTERLCLAQAGKRVFRRAPGGAAVADHPRKRDLRIDLVRDNP